MDEFENSEEVFTCQCSEPAHQLVFRIYNDKDFDYRFLNAYVCLVGYPCTCRMID